MEAIEFYVWEGKVRYRWDGEERILHQDDKEIIGFVLQTLRTFFPDALKAVNEGFTAVEIAGVLKKSIKTVKNQLTSVTKRLKLNRTRDIIKVFSVYNGFTLWE